MKYFYFFILIGILFIGCKTQPEDTSIYIGGEIVNPKSDVVLLMQKDKIIDSIPLKKNNTFGKRISEIKPGLYYFKHAYEFQYLYLEPQDSIHLRLNTWDFDETLVFEGKGAAKNELLLNLFLENEKEETIFYSYFSLPENEFLNKIDEANTRHTELLTNLVETDNTLSKQYLHLAEAAIKYPLLRLKELYPYYHKKTLGLDSVVKVSSNFYSYRKHTNLNDSFLSEYYAYQNFVSAHLYNLAYHENNGKIFDKNFSAKLIQIIANKIKTPDLKNRFLRREINYLFFSKPDFIDAEYLKIFYKNCTDSTTINNFNQLKKDREALPINNHFPNFMIQSTQGETSEIEKVILNKNAVIYFCSAKNIFDEYLVKRIQFLKNKYPQITFIGLIYNDSGFSKSCFNSKIKEQYYLAADSDGYNFISTNYTRTILVDSNGNVANSFTLLTGNQIEKQLYKLIKP